MNTEIAIVNSGNRNELWNKTIITRHKKMLLLTNGSTAGSGEAKLRTNSRVNQTYSYMQASQGVKLQLFS
jgi:hypothetical protein